MLDLRLNSEGINSDQAKVIHPKYVFNGKNTLSFVKDLITQISASGIEASSGNAVKPMLLIPMNINNQHWVGMTVEFADGKIKLSYMDSEENAMPKSLHEGLKVKLAKTYPDSAIEIVEKEVELQKYNNCGPEVIENFMLHLIGERLSQEEALEGHSILCEQYLIAKALQEEKAKHEHETRIETGGISIKHPDFVEEVKKETKMESANVIEQISLPATKTDPVAYPSKNHTYGLFLGFSVGTANKPFTYGDYLILDLKMNSSNFPAFANSFIEFKNTSVSLVSL